MQYMDLDEAARKRVDYEWSTTEGAPGNSAQEWFDGLSGDRQSLVLGGTGGEMGPPAASNTGAGNATNVASAATPSPSSTPELQQVGDTFYLGPEKQRVLRQGQAPPRQGGPDPAMTAEPPVYDDNGMAADTTSTDTVDNTSSGRSSRRTSSGGGSSSGTSDPAVAAAPAWPFADGFGGDNVYPTLPMTAQRRKVLENLSAVFPNAGQFRTPPGGWREDMAPMFTTGAFGPVTPPKDTANGAIPAGPPPAPAAPAPAPLFMAAPAPEQAAPAPALPDPTLMPPGAEMGIAPPDQPVSAPAPLPTGFPAFNRPGFVAPGSPAALRMPQPGGAPPLPASLRQRYGL